MSDVEPNELALDWEDVEWHALSALSALFLDAEFAPLSSVLLRTESASSSQIEDITTGARSLVLAEVGPMKYGSNAALVAANVDAMNHALALSQGVTPQSILDVHEAAAADVIASIGPSARPSVPRCADLLVMHVIQQDISTSRCGCLSMELEAPRCRCLIRV